MSYERTPSQQQSRTLQGSMMMSSSYVQSFMQQAFDDDDADDFDDINDDDGAAPRHRKWGNYLTSYRISDVKYNPDEYFERSSPLI